MRIAVLGLGGMGSAIAGRLLDAGHSLRVWNRTPERADQLVARGAERAGSPVEAVRGTKAAITSLSDDEAVRSVVLGSDGVVHGLGAEAVLVDMSTVSPETSRAIGDALNGRFVDAPILGGPPAVRAREATPLLGGDPRLLERLAPVFGEISTRQLHCGPIGSGVTVKIVANLLLLGQLGVLAEAVATAQASGVADDLIRQLGRTPLVAPALHNRLDDVIAGEHQGWFSARLGQKDVRLARSLAANGGLDLAVAAAVDALYEDAITGGLGDRDIAAVVEAVRAHRTGGVAVAR
jgi:3-hydroxyisobutyrate dehydrogenase-like beta-hydroxyacid dehydrogenase